MSGEDRESSEKEEVCKVIIPICHLEDDHSLLALTKKLVFGSIKLYGHDPH